jgi:formate dehydrogenase major subunit
VFFIPGAPAAEKDGSLTNTMRLVQWHERAVEPPGDARSDAAFVVDLGLRLKGHYKDSKARRDRPVVDLVWDYQPQGPKKEPRMELVLKEINGYATEDITDKDGKPQYAKGQPLKAFAHLRDDGATACGNWIMGGVYPEEGKNLAARREKPKEGDYLAHEWGFVWPANRRILYNRASAAALERAEEAHLVGREGQEVGGQGRARLRCHHGPRRLAGEGGATEGDRRP